MTTNEFINNVEKYGCLIDDTSKEYIKVCNKFGEVLYLVSKNKNYALGVYNITSSNGKLDIYESTIHEVFELVYEYAKTPIVERSK